MFVSVFVSLFAGLFVCLFAYKQICVCFFVKRQNTDLVLISQHGNIIFENELTAKCGTPCIYQNSSNKRNPKVVRCKKIKGIQFTSWKVHNSSYKQPKARFVSILEDKSTRLSFFRSFFLSFHMYNSVMI